MSYFVIGTYSLHFNDSQVYNVEIAGSSPFNFKYQFVKVYPSGLTYPVSGNPIAGTVMFSNFRQIP